MTQKSWQTSLKNILEKNNFEVVDDIEDGAYIYFTKGDSSNLYPLLRDLEDFIAHVEAEAERRGYKKGRDDVIQTKISSNIHINQVKELTQEST